MNVVFGGIAVLILAILLAKPLHMNILGAVLIVVFGFLFVTVSSRLTGEIGSSSNPISGMTVATPVTGRAPTPKRTRWLDLGIQWVFPSYRQRARLDT